MDQPGQGFRIGDCEVAPEDGTVLAPHGLQRIGPRPMALLRTLAAHPGRVLSREELMAAVWAGLVVSDETLSRCISDLRQALGDDSHKPRYIETLSRRGYRLIAPPRPAAVAPDPTVEAEIAAPTPGPVAEPAAGRAAPEHTVIELPASRAGRPWQIVTLALLIAAGAAMLATRDTDRVLDAAAPAPEANRLAILPFDDLSPAGDHRWFADGLTREILHGLAQLPEFQVMARQSTFQFRERPGEFREVARALGVGHLVEGSVRPSGDGLRITAQLSRTSDGALLWSESYDVGLHDVLSVQEQIASGVSRMLEVYLDEGRLRTMFATGTRHPDAFLHYLRGRALFDQAHVEGVGASELLWQADEWFTRALEADPAYAPPQFYRMDAYSHVLQHDMAAPAFLRDDSGEPDLALIYARLREDLEGALGHAGETSFAKVIALVSHFLQGRWELLPPLIDAVDENVAIEASELLNGGYFYFAPLILGRHEEAARVWRALRDHDPLAAFPWRALAGTALVRQDYAQVLEVAAQAEANGVDHIGLFEAQVSALTQLGRTDEAMALIGARAERGVLRSRWWLESLVHVERGDFREVARLLAEPRESDPRSDRHCWLLARIGRTAEANDCAAEIDAEPLGAVRLAKMVVEGGSIPFDAEAAPRFSALLVRSGAPAWPRTPTSAIGSLAAAPKPAARR